MFRTHLAALVTASAVLSCAPMIGLDDLHPSACVTICEEVPDAAAWGDARSSTTAGVGSSVSSTTSGAAVSTTSTGNGGAGGGTGATGGASAGGAATGGSGPGAGGGASTGSGGSSGGSMPGFDGGATLREELIDAIDDNRLPHMIPQSHGRIGYWVSVNDGTPGGTQSPPPDVLRMTSGGVNGGSYAAHLTGQGFTNWGIDIEVTLNKSPMGPKYSYDARAYVGVTFWAKAGTNDMCTPTSACHTMRLDVSTHDTDPRGNVCTACDDNFGAWVTLTRDWQKYTVLFSDLVQEGWGVPGPSQGTRFDAGRTYSIKFQVKPAGGPFDYWIDDVAFVLP